MSYRIRCLSCCYTDTAESQEERDAKMRLHIETAWHTVDCVVEEDAD